MSDETEQQQIGGRLTPLVAVLARRIDFAILAVLAYLPALFSSPGRMPADTKLYLYTDPGGLIDRAASTFEPDQLAGWVPHQQITYLWPSGPWFWVFDALAVPDWIAHRLWIGSIMFAAGAGARHCARHLGHGGAAALAAAAVYQLSPYLLPYISRTSLLLLPWAGLGWIVAATIRATRSDVQATRLDRWRDPAVIALIVATVGSTNATALAMIVPAPAIWIALGVWQRRLELRRVLAVAARVATVCVAVSLWWVAMLLVQSRWGAPVLLYSETLEDVSRNSTGPEVFRGMGYWLFYGRDAFAATTTASIDYLTRSSGIVISFALAIVGLVGIGFGRIGHRQFPALLVGLGVVLAVGVHPIDDSSPLMKLLTSDSEAGLALALRSSTRAVPIVVLGLALGTAGLVERASTVPIRASLPAWASARRVSAAAVVVAAVVNMPSVWQAGLVDPALDRDSELPDVWNTAAAALDAQLPNTRVLQLPGAEFGAFNWGYTVDQPLVSATTRPLVTRDLLPLGAAPAMDLLYALDDRVQAGTLDPESLAPVARLFGVSTVWVANDVDALRFRTPRPGAIDDLIAHAPGIAKRTVFGEARPAPDHATDLFGRPLVDADAIVAAPAAVAPVVLANIADPQTIIRAKTNEILLSGSGDGIVDAAAAGLIDGTELLHLGGDIELVDPSMAVIVTDSSRDRARHWRSSQDVLGHTEPGGPGIDVLTPTAADQRLNPYENDHVEGAQTVAVQRGPVTALASAYGEPFAYRPESRAVMAIDGDLATAWSVGDHGDPIGEVLRLTPNQVVESLTLHQLSAPDDRTITSISIELTGTDPLHVELNETSTAPSGQRVLLNAPTKGPIDIVLTGVTGTAGTTAAAAAGVGFTEIDMGLGPTIEYMRPPTNVLQHLSPDHELLDIVFTRERIEATSHWRSDPEPVLRRLLPLSSTSSVEVTGTVRLDQRANDVDIAAVIGDEGATADRRLPGVDHRGAAAVDGDTTTTWLTPVDNVTGATLTLAAITEPIQTLEMVQPVGLWSTITEVVIAGPDLEVTAAVPPPGVDGRSRIALPTRIGAAGQPLTISISQIAPSTAIERRYGDTVTMPAGIVELTDTTGIEVAESVGDNTVTSACKLAPLTIDGEAIRVRFEASVATLLAGGAVRAASCDGAIDLAAGEHIVAGRPMDAAWNLDQVVLSTRRTSTLPSAANTVELVEEGDRSNVVDIDCPAGCWLVFGMGHNEAWTAAVGGRDLGKPQLVDGGFNGWWIEPTSGEQRVRITWTAQRAVTIGLIISFISVLGLIGVVGARAWRRRDVAGAGTSLVNSADRVVAHSWIFNGVFAMAVAILVTPVWGLVALAVAAAEHALRHVGRWRPILAASGLLLAALVAVSVVFVERREAPFPNAGWTTTFDHLHGLMLTSIALVVASTFVRSRPDRK